MLPGLDKVFADIASLDGVTITLGVQGTAATTATGAASPGELVEIATRLHYGFGGIPPRPWLLETLRRNRLKWLRASRVAFVRAARGDPAAAAQTIRILGVVMVGDAQKTIRDGPWTPNSPSTIARKGSDAPLIDTGQLIQSQRAQVETPAGVEVIG